MAQWGDASGNTAPERAADAAAEAAQVAWGERWLATWAQPARPGLFATVSTDTQPAVETVMGMQALICNVIDGSCVAMLVRRFFVR
jgi:hypothetical protein